MKHTRKIKRGGNGGFSVQFAGKEANGTRRNRKNTLMPPTVTIRKKGLFTLLMTDPDAPAGNWLHWLVVNIPDGAVQKGKIITSYAPPTPPSGVHRYYISLYKQESPIDMTVSERAAFDNSFFENIYGLTKIGEKMIRVANST